VKPDSRKLTPEAQLRSFIDRFDPKDQKLIRSVRAAVRKRFPTANELAYDYNNSIVIGYSPTDRGIDGIVAISARATGVALYFNQGHQLPDPKKLLLGSGKQTRFVRVDAAGQLAHPDVEAMIAAAMIRRGSVAIQREGQTHHSRGCSEAAATPEADEVTAGVAEATWRLASVVHGPPNNSMQLRRFAPQLMLNVSPLQEHVMRALRYSINVTLDGCCDHRAIAADEELHRHAIENLDRADALLFGRVTYEMMEAAFRPPAGAGARPDWMEPFARTIDAAKKYVVSSTLDRVDWNAELVRVVRGDLETAVQQLKRESGKGLFVGGVKLPLALAELGLIDEYEFVVQPRLAATGRRCSRAIEESRFEAPEPAGVRLGGDGDAV